VNADLENGYADDPGERDDLRLAADAGIVGGSIEDGSGDPADHTPSISPSSASPRRPRWRTPSFPFTFTARAGIPARSPHLDDTVRRLQALRPGSRRALRAGLRDLETIGRWLRAVGKPLNIV